MFSSLAPGKLIPPNDMVRYMVKQQEFGIHVDTNRDGKIDDLDEIGKGIWTNEYGAIILFNGDDSDGSKMPDYMDNHINGEDDLKDIGVVRVTKPGVSLNSGNWSVVMTLAPVHNEDIYWTTNFSPQERVRIFLPTKLETGGDIVCRAGDVGILGGEIKDDLGGYVTTGASSIMFTSNSIDPLLDISIFEGMGSINFGIEGLVPGAPVRIITELYRGIDLVKKDIVEVKVTPFIAFSHESLVERSDEYRPTVFVSQENPLSHTKFDNYELRDKLRNEYGALLSEVTLAQDHTDPWWQDPFAVGYVQAPYGSQYVILALPRAHRNSYDFLNYAKNQMIRNGVGHYEKFAFTPGASGGEVAEVGGNFEVMPGQNSFGNSLGTIVMAIGRDGSVMPSNIVDFLIAQGVQDVFPQNVIDGIDLSWMLPGHIDEVISFATSPDGRARVASPEATWVLLLIAQRETAGNPSSPVMLQGMIDHNGNKMNSGLTVNDVLADTGLYNDNFYRIGGVNGYSDELIETVRGRFQLESPVSNITAINGAPANTLWRAGYLECYDDDGVELEWQVVYSQNGNFAASCRIKGTASSWTPDGVGNRNEDFVSNSKRCYILKAWWGISNIASGQGYTFNTRPSSNMIEMPVLFHNLLNKGAIAYTNNVINSLVDGDTLFVANVHGPIVNGTNLFNWYVSEAAKRVGFTNVIVCEERAYHNWKGSIHCGTNVLRKMPLYAVKCFKNALKIG